MKQIYKYEIPATHGISAIELPHSSHFLSVDNQEGKLVTWVKVSPENPTRIYKILCLFTGETVPDEPVMFLGTVLFVKGLYVVHVFVMMEEPDV